MLYHDVNRRMLSVGSRTFTYAGFDAPVTISNSAGAVTFSFDAELGRVKQAAPEGTTLYFRAQGVVTEKFTRSDLTVF